MSENPPDTIVPLKSAANIRAYSEVGFANLNNRAMPTIDHLLEDRKWSVIARQHLDQLRENGQLTFGDALEAMKAGYMVKRAIWPADKTVGLDRTLPSKGKLMGSPISGGHTCPDRNSCEYCTERRERNTRSYPQGAFFVPANSRFSTVLDEISARDIISEDWVVLEKVDESIPPA